MFVCLPIDNILYFIMSTKELSIKLARKNNIFAQLSVSKIKPIVLRYNMYQIDGRLSCAKKKVETPSFYLLYIV